MSTRRCSNCKEVLDDDSLPVGPRLAQWLCKSCLDMIENPWTKRAVYDRGKYYAG